MGRVVLLDGADREQLECRADVGCEGDPGVVDGHAGQLEPRGRRLGLAQCVEPEGRVHERLEPGRGRASPRDAARRVRPERDRPMTGPAMHRAGQTVR